MDYRSIINLMQRIVLHGYNNPVSRTIAEAYTAIERVESGDTLTYFLKATLLNIQQNIRIIFYMITFVFLTQIIPGLFTILMSSVIPHFSGISLADLFFITIVSITAVFASTFLHSRARACHDRPIFALSLNICSLILICEVVIFSFLILKKFF